MKHANSRHLAALALVGWYLMMPPDSTRIPHDVEADAPLSHWIVVANFPAQDGCEKALADLQNKDEDPIDLDQTGKLKRFQKNPPDAALAKARAINAGCVAADDFRLKAKK